MRQAMKTLWVVALVALSASLARAEGEKAVAEVKPAALPMEQVTLTGLIEVKEVTRGEKTYQSVYLVLADTGKKLRLRNVYVNPETKAKTDMTLLAGKQVKLTGEAYLVRKQVEGKEQVEVRRVGTVSAVEVLVPAL